MENRWVSLGICIIIIISAFITGCFDDDPIDDNKPPIIKIVVAETVYNNTSFHFNVFLEDPDGNITQSHIQWDFENDRSYDWDSEDEDSYLDIIGGYYKQKHSFEKPGKYTARLVVTDEDGIHAEEECTVTVISHSMSFETSLNKNIYMIDEPILLTCSLKNGGPIPINVSKMAFEFPTLGDSQITTPEGYIIQSYLYIAMMPYEVTIEGRGEYSEEFDLTNGHWGIWDGESWTHYNLTQRGKYTLQVVYDSYPNGEVLNCRIETDPMTFVLV